MKKVAINAKDIRPRLTGFSTPAFGLSWEYADSERSAVRKFVTLLEDRRVLYDPTQLEIESDVNYSVGEIRKYASDALASISEGSPAANAIRAIRAACRKYQTYKDVLYPNVAALDAGLGRGAGWLTGLGEFRAIVGIHLAALATMFDIDVEEDLASIFPLADLE